jgi:hypothetical protein
MRVTSLMLLSVCTCPAAQVIMGGSGQKGAVTFRYETRIEPEIPGQKLNGFGAGGLVVTSVFHRYMTDSAARKYFGYDLMIDPTPEGKYRVTFLPLTLNAARLQLDQPTAWSLIPLPSLPPPVVVGGRKDRQQVAVDLFVYPITGQRIVDYLSIGDDRHSPRLPSGSPRDFTVDDAPLTLTKPRLLLNGTLVEAMGGGISGEAVYLYLPGHGRYAFSLAANAPLGFRKAGEVRGKSLSFAWGGNTVVFECEEPVAPGGGVFNLYVRHEPSWRPRGKDQLELGASSASAMVRHP